MREDLKSSYEGKLVTLFCVASLVFLPNNSSNVIAIAYPFPSISRYIINKEDVFITVAGTIGRVGKIPPELDGANLTENADRLVFSVLDQGWFILELQSSLIQTQIIEATTKVGQPKLAIARIENLLIALPPLSEQRRIVEKQQELFDKITLI